jgi:hypothetical protein
MIEWRSGIDNYKIHTVIDNTFTIEYLEQLSTSQTISELYLDYLSARNNKFVEVMYSGGIDSEIILLVCLKNNIPVRARTVRIYFKDMIVNSYDLYHASEFCRKHNIDITYMNLELTKYYQSQIDIDLSTKYFMPIPYASITAWASTYCSGFVCVGGDYPWPVKTNGQWSLAAPSPSINSFDRLFSDYGITGIGNIQTNSLDSLKHFVKAHIEVYSSGIVEQNVDEYYYMELGIPKHLIFKRLGFDLEPRLKRHGFEHLNRYRKFHDILTEEYQRRFSVPISNIIIPESLISVLNRYSNT